MPVDVAFRKLSGGRFAAFADSKSFLLTKDGWVLDPSLPDKDSLPGVSRAEAAGLLFGTSPPEELRSKFPKSNPHSSEERENENGK